MEAWVDPAYFQVGAEDHAFLQAADPASVEEAVGLDSLGAVVPGSFSAAAWEVLASAAEVTDHASVEEVHVAHLDVVVHQVDHRVDHRVDPLPRLEVHPVHQNSQTVQSHRMKMSHH